jgi:hypothetical protein
LEALPVGLQGYVRQTALALGCDAAFVALPVLAVAASVIGNTRTIRLKRGWEEPAVVWAAVVGDSGTLKSPAWLKAMAHLFRLQKQLLKEHKATMAKYQEKLQQYKDRKREAKEGGTDPDEPPEKPVLQRIVCSDTTIEKLAEILEDNPRGILVARDELAGWLGSFTRYKGKQGGSDLPNWLEMFRAGTIIVDRKTGERRTLYVPRATVSVAGGIQPGVLVRALTPEFLDAGLAARLLLAMPLKLPKRWSDAEVSAEAEQMYHDTLDRLLKLELGRDRHSGEKGPHVLHLSREAKAVWIAFYNEWALEQAAAEGELAAALSKLEAYAARFALIHHVVTHVALESDDKRDIGPRSIEAGITLARWFARETRRIYAMLAETEAQRDTRRLVEFIQARGGRVTAKDLQRSNSRKYHTATVAELALDSLVSDGLAEWQERPPSAKGGRPTRDCVLVPATAPDETDETSPATSKPPPRPSDETSYETPLATQNPNVSGGFVGFVNSRKERESQESRPEDSGEVSSDAGEVSSDGHGDAYEGS